MGAALRDGQIDAADVDPIILKAEGLARRSAAPLSAARRHRSASGPAGLGQRRSRAGRIARHARLPSSARLHGCARYAASKIVSLVFHTSSRSHRSGIFIGFRIYYFAGSPHPALPLVVSALSPTGREGFDARDFYFSDFSSFFSSVFFSSGFFSSSFLGALYFADEILFRFVFVEARLIPRRSGSSSASTASLSSASPRVRSFRTRTPPCAPRRRASLIVYRQHLQPFGVEVGGLARRHSASSPAASRWARSDTRRANAGASAISG